MFFPQILCSQTLIFQNTRLIMSDHFVWTCWTQRRLRNARATTLRHHRSCGIVALSRYWLWEAVRGGEFVWWWQLKYFLFSSLFGEMIHFDWYFSIRLKPPTRFFWWNYPGWIVIGSLYIAVDIGLILDQYIDVYLPGFGWIVIGSYGF